MTRVIVIGGGLAGLVAARHLARAGLTVEVFERRDEVGGRVRSREREGFVFDYGFQVLLAGYPAARRELDYDALDLRSFAPGATLARPGARSVVSDPRRDLGGFIETLLATDATLGDKLRVLALIHTVSGVDESDAFSGSDRSIREFLRDRGFSERFVKRFFAPFYGGITLDSSLSTSAAVFSYTFRMLATGAIAIPAAGMGTIGESLATAAREYGTRIHLDTMATTIETTDDSDAEAMVTVGGETHTADAVVVATDPKAARDLTGVEFIPTDARGCVTQYFSMPTHDAPDLGNRLVLNAGRADTTDVTDTTDTADTADATADNGPNHVAPLSAVAPEYAPAGQELLSATYIGIPDASDVALATRVRETLESWYPDCHFETLELRATDRIGFAQFAQPPGFYRRLPSIDAPDGPVYLAGEYTRWSSIHAAMDSGRAAARAVLDST